MKTGVPFPYIESIEFAFQQDNKIIYTCCDNTFCFVGELSNTINYFWIQSKIKDTLDRFLFLKNLPVSMVTIINHTDKVIDNLYENEENICFDGIITNMFPVYDRSPIHQIKQGEGK